MDDNHTAMMRRRVRFSLGIAAAIVLCLHFPSTLSAQDSVVTVELDGLRMEMVWVEGGTFTMGSNRAPEGVSLSYEASRPEHRVSVGSYYICRHEVTQALWVAVMGENPSRFTSSDSLPVEQVSWNDAQRFVTLLSQMTGRRFRLPSEAEWEYAARGGAKMGRKPKPFAGCERGQLPHYAWFCVNSERTTHRVGTRAANDLGLYDMSGNVAEWCSDWMAPYTADEQSNPRGPRAGDSRVLRGGHYNSVSSACTVYDRGWYVPTATSEYFGLRVVLESE